MDSPYPLQPGGRDDWILARRTVRPPLDPRRPYAFHLEEEPLESGEVVSVATIFLTNRECPWHCLMCDLWKNTLAETVPVGAIPAQIHFALQSLDQGFPPSDPSPEDAKNQRLPPRSTVARILKLYNSGSFFDGRAIPLEDHGAIAATVRSFERIIVECHPALIGNSALRFRNLLRPSSASDAGQASSLSPSSPRPTPRLPQLEIAMGLETAHPEVLAKLNKRMTLDQFRRAAAFLREHEIALRTFILVKPPFLDEAEALDWARRSLDFAFDCGAAVASLIPTRPGNGAMETLMAQGDFSPPKLALLEAAAEYGIGRGRGRVFADLWDLERFSDCAFCFPARRARLAEMNLRQRVPPAVPCSHCADAGRPRA